MRLAKLVAVAAVSFTLTATVVRQALGAACPNTGTTKEGPYAYSFFSVCGKSISFRAGWGATPEDNNVAATYHNSKTCVQSTYDIHPHESCGTTGENSGLECLPAGKYDIDSRTGGYCQFHQGRFSSSYVCVDPGPVVTDHKPDYTAAQCLPTSPS